MAIREDEDTGAAGRITRRVAKCMRWLMSAF